MAFTFMTPVIALCVLAFVQTGAAYKVRIQQSNETEQKLLPMKQLPVIGYSEHDTSTEGAAEQRECFDCWCGNCRKCTDNVSCANAGDPTESPTCYWFESSGDFQNITFKNCHWVNISRWNKTMGWNATGGFSSTTMTITSTTTSTETTTSTITTTTITTTLPYGTPIRQVKCDGCTAMEKSKHDIDFLDQYWSKSGKPCRFVDMTKLPIKVECVRYLDNVCNKYCRSNGADAYQKTTKGTTSSPGSCECYVWADLTVKSYHMDPNFDLADVTDVYGKDPHSDRDYKPKKILAD